MTTSSAPEHQPDPHPAGGATRRVSVFGRNGRDGRLDRDAAEAEWQDAQATQAVSAGAALSDVAATTALSESYAPADYAGTGYTDTDYVSAGAGSPPTMAMPVDPNYAVSPDRPTYAPGDGHTQSAAQAALPAPVRLPAPPTRRHTAATPLGTILVLVASALLGWGIYTLLTSLDVFAVVQSGDLRIDTMAAAAFAVGGVLAFVGFIIACVAVVRARPKTAAALLLLASLVLPTAATAGGAYYGAMALKEQTTAQAQAYVGAIDVDRVDAVITEVESWGVDIPGKEKVLDILRAAKGEG